MTLPKEFSVFGEDYGTSEFKFGVATLGNTPDTIDSRGYFPDMRSALLNLNSRSGKEISSGRDGQLLIVGPPVAQHLEASQGYC